MARFCLIEGIALYSPNVRERPNFTLPRQRKTSSLNNTAPIFIGGLMRSGTTLLRAMLGQHSAIASGLETQWFDIDWPAQRSRGGEPLADYLHRIGDFFEIAAGQVNIWMAAADSAEGFLDLFMGSVAQAAGKRRWAEKTTGNIRHLDRILAHWPEAQIIHLIRDPRDIFASFRRSEKYGGIEDYANLWCDYLGDVERFKRALPLRAGNYLELRYEALVRDPPKQMAMVTRFLGEDWEEAVGRFEGKADEHDRVLGLTGHSSTTLEQIAQPLRRDRVGLGRGSIGDGEMATAREVVAARGLGGLFARIEAGE